MEFTVVPPRKYSGPHTLRECLSTSFMGRSLSIELDARCLSSTNVISTRGTTLKSYESFPSYLFHPVERSRYARYLAVRNSAIRESFKRVRIYARLIKLRFHDGPMKN